MVMGYRSELRRSLRDYAEQLLSEATTQRTHQRRRRTIETIYQRLGIQQPRTRIASTLKEDLRKRMHNFLRQQALPQLKKVPARERRQLMAWRAWVMETLKHYADPSYVPRIPTPPFGAEQFDSWWLTHEKTVNDILRGR